MDWILKYLRSSIGRKQIMGLTGAILAFWILAHMVGNIPLIMPNAADAYNAYAHMLTGNKNVLYAMEAVMSLVLFAHFYLAITLKKENVKARGSEKYLVNAYSGDKNGAAKKNFTSFYMVFSGIWILAYLVFHLVNLKFGTYYETMLNGEVVRDMYKTAIQEFGNPVWALVYVASMGVLAMHLTHAISSAFQTMGISHSRWNGILNLVAKAYVVAVAGGFGIIAIGAHIIGRSAL
jgi:succinate dehydrogenase / fumarate reductase, cytochrome b subunit